MEEKKKKGKLKWVVLAVVIVVIIAAASSKDDEVKKVDTQTTKNEEQQEAKNEEKKEDNSQEDTKSEENDEKETEAEKEEPEKLEFGVGETAEYKDIQVTLEKAVISKGDGEFVTPEDGNVFVLCSFLIQNNSSEDISISSIGCFEAYCDDTTINEDIIGLQAPEAKGQNQLDGDVASGKKMKGVIAYQVPKNWKKLEINVTPDFWSVKDIKFVIKNK